MERSCSPDIRQKVPLGRRVFKRTEPLLEASFHYDQPIDFSLIQDEQEIQIPEQEISSPPSTHFSKLSEELKFVVPKVFIGKLT